MWSGAPSLRTTSSCGRRSFAPFVPRHQSGRKTSSTTGAVRSRRSRCRCCKAPRCILQSWQNRWRKDCSPAMYEQKAAPPPVRQIINPLVLVILVAADAAFVALHLSNRFLPSRNPLFSLSTDGGYAELFQYLKEGWVAAVLFVVCWRTRQGL